MAYLYIHIPQDFPTGFFEESKFISCIGLKENSIKGECCETTSIPNRHPFTDDLICPYGFV